MTAYPDRSVPIRRGGDPQSLGQILNANAGKFGRAPSSPPEGVSISTDQERGEVIVSFPIPSKPEAAVCNTCHQPRPFTYRNLQVAGRTIRGNVWNSPIVRDGICKLCLEEREDREAQARAKQCEKEIVTKYLMNCGISESEQQRLLLFNYLPQNAKQARLFELCKTIVQGERVPFGKTPHLTRLNIPDHGIYVSGPVGTGKTDLMSSIIIDMCKGCVAGVRVKVPDMFADLKNSFKDHSLGTLYRAAENAKVLLLDDIGSERPTEWVLAELFRLIDGRYTEDKLTFFTSNLSIGKLAQRLGDDRITSRIGGLCNIFEIDGPDWRVDPR